MNQPLPGLTRQSFGGTPGRTGAVSLNIARAPDGRSYIARQHATYPFHVCRPHHVAGDPQGMATLYLQSVSGGMFEHDRLAVDAIVGDGAALHLTSQGATIVHAMTEGSATLATRLEAGAGSVIEMLPEATILFPGARLSLETTLCAAPDAVACVSESFVAHDPDGGGASFGSFVSDLRFVGTDGQVLVHDRQAIGGEAFGALSTGSGPRLTTYGTIHLWAPGHDLPGLVEDLTSGLSALEGAYAGASPLPHGCGLTVRALAVDGAALRQASATAWAAIRTALFAAPPARRRK